MGHEEVCSRQSNDADVHAQLVHVHVFFHACPKCFSFLSSSTAAHRLSAVWVLMLLPGDSLGDSRLLYESR